ncbi:MAG: sialidase family protein, partial [bacterium]
FGFTPGKLSKLPNPSATVNPYKIFADGLQSEDDYYQWISSAFHANQRGIFRAGMVNSRRYQMKFPIVGGVPVVKFQYAVIASWVKGDPSLTGNPSIYDATDFPIEANCDEAIFVHMSTVASDLYNSGTGLIGGNFRADVEVFDWASYDLLPAYTPKIVPDEVERIIVEGDFLPGGSHEWSQAELAPLAVPSTSVSSVFQVEVADCTPAQAESALFRIIIESSGENGDSYYQGFSGTPYPPDAKRAAFSIGTVNITTDLPFNTPPIVNGIEDDIYGSGNYKNPVDTKDESVTYTVLFDDPDTGQTHTITWWITPYGIDPMPPYEVTMPIDWSSYDPGEYDIYVDVFDGFESGFGGPFGITLEKAPNEGWTDPVNIDFGARMPRACQNAEGKIVLAYHKQDVGISYAIDEGLGWSEGDVAHDASPDFMQIAADQTGPDVFVGYESDEFGPQGKHALRWQGNPGLWDYMSCQGTTDLASAFLPNDDGSFINVFTTGTNVSFADFPSWLGLQGTVVLTTDDNECIFSSTNFADRGSSDHFIAYSRDNKGDIAARILKISKSDVSDWEKFTIFSSGLIDTIGAPALCRDSSGVLHAAWKVTIGDEGGIYYSQSTDNGETWTDQVTVFYTDWQYDILDGYIGIDTDSSNQIFITYAREPYIYMVHSDDGINWSDPTSPYEKQLPLGWHWSQPFPLVTSDDLLHVFFVAKNDQWQQGGLNEVIWGK